MPSISLIPKRVARNLKWAYNDYRIYHAGPDPAIRKSGTLFIHVPKCAGTSIAAAIYGKKLPHITLQEYALKMSEKELRSLNTVSVVRDPLDRIRSLYKYVQRSYPNARHDIRHAYHRFHLAGSLGEFLETLDSSYVDCTRLLWPQFRFLQLGWSVPDWVSLYQFTGLDELQKDLGKPLEVLNRAPDVSEEPLSDRAIDNVRKLYAEDYEAFGFPTCGSGPTS